jgi:Tol biopolymer transport system component
MKDANQFVFFSPDSDWIAFHADGKLQKIRVTGGVPVDLVDLGAHPGAAWGSRNTIVYPETWTSGLYEISADGGEPRQITTLDTDQGETGHWSPSFLPDGRHVLFTVFTTRGSLKHSRMDLVDLDTGERVSLGIGAYPIYLTSGHIIYHRSGLYEMSPFDIKEKKITGSAKIVMKDVPPVAPQGMRTRYFSLSGNGVLAFVDVDDSEVASTTLHRLDRAGKLDRLFPPPAMHYGGFDVSPEGTRLVSSVSADGEHDLWVYDLEHQTSRRVTRESNNIRPSWHPDGRRIAFTSTRLGTFDAFGLDIDSGGPPAPLLTSQQDVVSMGWEPDGALIVRVSTVEQADNLVILKEGATSNLVATEAREDNASVSGSGRWIAYTSDRSGIQEVYVQQLIAGKVAIQISTGGGGNPRWSRTSNELIYNNGPTLGEIMRVSYEDQDGRFVASRPVPFLRNTSQDDAGELPLVAARVFGEFAVSLHGELIVSLYETTPAPSVHIVLDGFGELERQAAAER